MCVPSLPAISGAWFASLDSFIHTRMTHPTPVSRVPWNWIHLWGAGGFPPYRMREMGEGKSLSLEEERGTEDKKTTQSKGAWLGPEEEAFLRSISKKKGKIDIEMREGRFGEATRGFQVFNYGSVFLY